MTDFIKSLILMVILVSIMHGVGAVVGYDFTILESILSGLFIGFISAAITEAYL